MGISATVNKIKDAIWFRTRPPLSRLSDDRGYCVVCGHTSRFLYNPWVIDSVIAAETPRDVADGYRRRESLWCSHCHASQRERGLTSALVTYYGRGASSLALALPAMRELHIAEINRFNAAHHLLAELPGIRYVEYPEEDIHDLSFGDASFDVVITSDTLEHVADPQRALQETFRVLRPGGRHIFTVPLRPDLAHSRSRSGLRQIHHGRPPGPWRHLRKPMPDMLVRTDFGRDFTNTIEAVGFDVEVHGQGVDIVFVGHRPV